MCTHRNKIFLLWSQPSQAVKLYGQVKASYALTTSTEPPSSTHSGFSFPLSKCQHHQWNPSGSILTSKEFNLNSSVNERRRITDSPYTKPQLCNGNTKTNGVRCTYANDNKFQISHKPWVVDEPDPTDVCVTAKQSWTLVVRRTFRRHKHTSHNQLATSNQERTLRWEASFRLRRLCMTNLNLQRLGTISHMYFQTEPSPGKKSLEAGQWLEQQTHHCNRWARNHSV